VSEWHVPFQEGEHVRIVGGAFRGFEGVVLRRERWGEILVHFDHTRASMSVFKRELAERLDGDMQPEPPFPAVPA
jgi:transcription antitermination factor NusG